MKQTAGRDNLGKLAPKFAELNDDILFGDIWSREELSNERDDIKIVSINIDEEDELTEKYEVSSIPCLVLLEKLKEIKRNVEFISKDEINTLLGGK